MKYCSGCGKEIMDQAVICPHCGCAVGKIRTYGDSSSIAWNIIAFLFPLLGIILYLLWRDDRPLRSASLLKGLKVVLTLLIIAAIIGILAAIVLV